MIRLLEKDDISAINNIAKNAIENFEKTYNLYDYLTNPNYIVIVNDDDKVNGFMIVHINYDFFELELISVDSNYQNKRIASNIMNYFFDNYNDPKYTNMILEVRVDNENAIKLYNKFDFKIINIRKSYYNGIDGYIMKKEF